MKRVVLLLALVHATSARADDEAPKRTPFDRGRFGFSAGAGSQNAFGSHYIIIGGGVGYYVLDGLEVGFFALHEFGNGPSISKVSPSLRYVAQPLVGKWPVIPYVGVFYNHWFIGDVYPDVDTVGSRGGFLYISGSIVLGLGVVVEREVSKCTVDCTQVYPDFTIGFVL